ncbi:hypothetical protein ACFXI6_14075 [Streptomyces mirabilis]|uniref:hypothetical protein n=1 Tax=Streptomyces mirabilis TaxID=68239 RepID=UPI00367C27E3
MQAFNSTTYELRIYASEGAQAVFQCTAADGYTDTFMIAFTEAVKGLTWPTGQTPTITLSKTAREDDYYTVDLSASTPAFS